MTFRRFPASTQCRVHTRRWVRMYASHAPRRACAHGRKDAAVGCMKCMYAPCRVRVYTPHRMRYNAGRRAFTRAWVRIRSGCVACSRHPVYSCKHANRNTGTVLRKTIRTHQVPRSPDRTRKTDHTRTAAQDQRNRRTPGNRTMAIMISIVNRPIY